MLSTLSTIISKSLPSGLSTKFFNNSFLWSSNTSNNGLAREVMQCLPVSLRYASDIPFKIYGARNDLPSPVPNGSILNLYPVTGPSTVFRITSF